MPIQDIRREQKGSALILVVIVTVLLSVIGIMFVMTMRIREMTTANAADDRDLDTAVGAVTGKIGTVLQQDLFGTGLDQSVINGGDIVGGVVINEASDSLSADPWLASLEPTLYDERVIADPTDDWYQWEQVTNLYGTALQPFQWDKVLRNGQTTDGSGTPWVLPQSGGIVDDYQKFITLVSGKEIPMTATQIQRFPADADGDGVADSRWVKIPAISTSRGKAVFTAVRIVDNCAMLNLNTAFGFYQQPPLATETKWQKPWCITSDPTWMAYPNGTSYGDNIGRYLSEVNFTALLRAYDDNRPERIQFARDTQAKIRNGLLPADPYYYAYNSQADDYHNKAVMNIGSSNFPFSFFDISDELEIRNRFLLTSKSSSRFEKRDPQEQTHANALPSIVIPVPANAYQGIAYQTFDFGQGQFGTDTWSSYFGVRVASVPRDATNFGQWKEKMNPLIFADNPYVSPNTNGDMWLYDRRHLCTFYSFDRNIRSGSYPLLEISIANYRQTNPVTANALERVFRPLMNRPIDLRTMTDPTRNDNIIFPGLPVFPAVSAADITDCHRNILHLLYAFREQEYIALSMGGGGPDPNALIKSARRAAQQVANIIDYMDDDTIGSTGPFGMVASSMDAAYGSQVNAKPTFINKGIIDAMLAEVSLAYSGSAVLITPSWASYSDFDFGLPAGEVVYGYERQPFISEMYCNYDPSGGAQGFALELLNPYSNAINLNGWRITIGSTNYPPLTAAFSVPGGTPTAPGRLVIYDGTIKPAWLPLPAGSQVLANLGLGTVLSGHILQLKRPNPAVPSAYLTVDETDLAQSTFLMGGSIGAGDYVSSRDDTAWKFTNNSAFNPATPTLGLPNNVTSAQKGYQLPVDNVSASLDRLADFQKITWVDPNGLTGHIAAISEEGEIRYDSQVGLELLHYVCTLSREEKGIPGRININTAPLHVIAAAIPPQLVMTAGDPNSPLELAAAIIQDRPYDSLTELLDDTESPHVTQIMKKYANSGLNPGDSSADNDLEERDWIFNRLSNIFTVRSDTFTAYILVRLGTDGPQRRMLAIFDRSNCWTAADKPRLVALHLVPDPR